MQAYTCNSKAYGAAFVASRMCLFFKCCASGRFWRCFSRELRRSRGETCFSSAGNDGASVESDMLDMDQYRNMDSLVP